MNKEIFLNILIILQFLTLSTTLPVSSQVPEGESLFKLNCSPCHSIGMGKLIGPDLAGVEKRRDIEWIKKFIRSSQTLVRGGDPTALKVYNENDQVLMPDQVALTDAQIEGILTFIKNNSQAFEQNKVENLRIVQDAGLPQKIHAVSDSSGNKENQNERISKGRELFLGSVRLQAGGPSCNSCHNVTEEIRSEGGVFAPDLTNVFSRIDEKEILELATAPRYPSMQKAYQDKPITQEEAELIAAFLKYAGTGSAYQQQRDQRAADMLKRIHREGPE